MRPSNLRHGFRFRMPERELKSSVIEKDAGAEILQWRVHVVDEYLSTGLQRVLWHYVRLKVFDANGKEKAGTVIFLIGTAAGSPTWSLLMPTIFCSSAPDILLRLGKRRSPF